MKTIYVALAPRSNGDPQNRQSHYATYIDYMGNEKRYSVDTIRNTNQQPIAFSFMNSVNKGMFVTGLDETIDNPFYNEDGVFYGTKTNWDEARLKKIATQKEITRQTYFEIKFDTEPGYLNVKAKHSPMQFLNDGDEKRTFIETFTISIYPGKLNVFKDDTLRGALAIQLCENHKQIAKTKEEVRSNTSKAYITAENEEVAENNRKEKFQNRAIAELTWLEAYDSDGAAMYKVAVVTQHPKTGQSIASGDINRDGVYSACNSFIKSGTKQTEENCKRFIDSVSEFKDKVGKLKFEVRYAVQQAINHRVFAISQGGYWWVSKSDVQAWHKLGNLDQLILFFMSEFEAYNPKSKDTTPNAWVELKKELEKKNVKGLI
jgi:hypothetical protein